MAKDKVFSRIPGFRDFPPGDLRIRSHIFDSWRRASGRYGFQEYDGPPLEALELYTEKSGDEIVGQLYNFRDKGGREEQGGGMAAMRFVTGGVTSSWVAAWTRPRAGDGW